MRNLDDRRTRRMLPHDAGRGRIVNDHRERPLRQPLQHRVPVIRLTQTGTGFPPPQFPRRFARPLPVVVHKLVDVAAFVERSHKEMLQQRVVQHHHAGLRERAGIDVPVKDIVGDVVQTHIGARRRQFHGSVRPQRGKQRSRVVGDSRLSRRHRRMESDLHS